jgi:hypothetical protein
MKYAIEFYTGAPTMYGTAFNVVDADNQKEAKKKHYSQFAGFNIVNIYELIEQVSIIPVQKFDTKFAKKTFIKNLLKYLKMKKLLFVFVASALLLTSTGCATIFGGKISDCQRTKPAPGKPARQVRIVPLVLDCCTGLVWLGIDFATGAIYKPCKPEMK